MATQADKDKQDLRNRQDIIDEREKNDRNAKDRERTEKLKQEQSNHKANN